MVETKRASSYSSGQLARLAGVSPDTLRHYERKGVLERARRLENGYRRYGPEAPDRVRLVRAAIGLGFSLDELAQVFAVRNSGGAPCTRVRQLAADKLESAETRLRELQELVATLRALVVAWDRRLVDTPAGMPAGLLESLDVDPPAVASTKARKARGGTR